LPAQCSSTPVGDECLKRALKRNLELERAKRISRSHMPYRLLADLEELPFEVSLIRVPFFRAIVLFLLHSCILFHDRF
jgi:hypothetical protein